MPFEHRKQKLLPFKHFVFRIGRFGLFSLLLIFVSVAIGTLGYYWLANLSLLDSFHMACMILTGMGPVEPMKSEAAKLFSALYALYSGVAFLSITAVFFAPIVHRLLHIMHVEKDENDDE